jgi:lanosterol synthase
MGYIYARRLSAPLTTFTQSLREELYTEDYDSIHWDSQRNNVSKVDLYTPHSKIMDILNYGLTYYEWIASKIPYFRNYALQLTVDQIKMEDENSFYLDIGPVK